MMKHDEINSEVHGWLRPISLMYRPSWSSPFLDRFASQLIESFEKYGNQVVDTPTGTLDVLLTTARFGEPVSWRTAALFTVRKRYHLSKTPTVVTLVHATSHEFYTTIIALENALSKSLPVQDDYSFPGLAPQAFLTLHEQGQRGGAILAFERLLQAQTKSIRLILVVGDDSPQFAYTFDLVGAYPRSNANDMEAFYKDLVLRVMTAISTHEITNHQVMNEKIELSKWQKLTTPKSMCNAGAELGERSFFSKMINVSDLVNVPAVPESIASQYSEGCFASWDPLLKAMITTVTGSARPINKYDLTEDDLAVVVGIRPDQQGAQVRHIADKLNSPPSSEALELIKIDAGLPYLTLGQEWRSVYGSLDLEQAQVPVTRSKLHGHRGIGSYDSRIVEYVPLDAPYHHYPVSCASEAQANAIYNAFSNSAALHDAFDSRQIVFTVLPGHGIVIVEKWLYGKAPFQLIWEFIDAGHIQVINHVPQGLFNFQSGNNGKMILHEI